MRCCKTLNCWFSSLIFSFFHGLFQSHISCLWWVSSDLPRGHAAQRFCWCMTCFFFLHIYIFGCVFCISISLSCQEIEPAQKEAYWGKMCQQFLFNTSLLKGKFVSQTECVHYFSGPTGTSHTIENVILSQKYEVMSVSVIQTRQMRWCWTKCHKLNLRKSMAFSFLIAWCLWMI